MLQCTCQPSLAPGNRTESKIIGPSYGSCSTALSYAGWANVWCCNVLNHSMQLTSSWGELHLPEIAKIYAGSAMQILLLCSSSSRVWVPSSFQTSWSKLHAIKQLSSVYASQQTMHLGAFCQQLLLDSDLADTPKQCMCC